MLKILPYKTKRELFTSFSVRVGITQEAHRPHKSTSPTFKPSGFRRKMCSSFPFFWWLIFLPLHAVPYSNIKFGQPPPCQPFLELWQSLKKLISVFLQYLIVPAQLFWTLLLLIFFYPTLDHFTICFWLFHKPFVSIVLWAPEVDVIFQKVYDISKYQH